MPDPFVQPILAEIARSLDRLSRRGEAAVIDLRGLPLGAADRDRLEAALGRGEVTVTVEAAGRTEIFETAFAGVWWVRHLGATGMPLTERIEIAPVPEALPAHPDDIAAAARRLAATLDAKEVAHV